MSPLSPNKLIFQLFPFSWSSDLINGMNPFSIHREVLIFFDNLFHRIEIVTYPMQAILKKTGMKRGGVREMP
jgi:hypothetical protein